jgi:CRISPR-associated protein Cmr2
VTTGDIARSATLEEIKDVKDIQTVVERLGLSLPSGWNDDLLLERDFLLVWRRLRHELLESEQIDSETWWSRSPARSLLWQRMPADLRSPDHSVWDHNRMAGALSFLDEQEPVLLSFEIGPIQSFIEQARTSRDLWTGSMLLSTMSLAAMGPIIRSAGPDAIIYPDLRGNPWVDRWLLDQGPDQLGLSQAQVDELIPPGIDPRSRAALIPNHFVAILPAAGVDDLLPAPPVLAEQCRDAVDQRWRDLSDRMRDRLTNPIERAAETTGVEISGWTRLWEAQHRQVLSSLWTTSEWPADPVGLTARRVGRGLPGQDPDKIARRNAELAGLNADPGPPLREQRLEPWMPPETWAHYETTREVFGDCDQDELRSERGFDYAPTHHRLQAWHAMRKNARTYADIGDEVSGPGDRCTVCSQRRALGPGLDEGGLDGQRADLTSFWRALGERLNEPRFGTERLCAVCLFRRMLVPEGEPESYPGDFNRVWTTAEVGEARERPNDPLKLPFPSTAAVAGQEFLAAVARDPDLAPYREAIVKAASILKWPRTQFPRSLPALDAAWDGHDRFLTYDAQIIHPHAVESELHRRGQKNGNLIEAINEFRRAAKKQDHGSPATRYALIALDGDEMGALLLGSPERINATWRQVLHPEIVAQLKDDENWRRLLDRPRLMGPALHAWLSRALADFAHRVVPWVVEQEFGGRLIYAGGDDVLALAPASEALDLAARLQQLYSSPWVLDTQPDRTAWDRHAVGTWNPYEGRRRFRIPAAPKGRAITLPLIGEYPHVCDVTRVGPSDIMPTGGAVGELIPMPGPYQSVSAGIVYAHFKTPLQCVIKQAKSLLDDQAKESKGRSAVAMSLWSRGGPKADTALRWYGLPDQHDDISTRPRAPDAAVRVRRLINAFRGDQLPGRLPYKLREAAPHLAALAEDADGEKLDMLLDGFLKRATSDGSLSERLFSDVLALWKEGRPKVDELRKIRGMRERIDREARALGGLLLCRALAGAGSDEEGEP